MRKNRKPTNPFDGVPLFVDCTPRQLAPMSAHADRLTVAAGTDLTRTGGAARELIVILAGEAMEDGRPVGPGTSLAAGAVAVRGEYPSTVTTVTTTEILVVNGPAFRGAVREIPIIARRIAEMTMTMPATLASSPPLERAASSHPPVLLGSK